MGMLHFCIALSRCLESLSQKLYAPVAAEDKISAFAQNQQLVTRIFLRCAAGQMPSASTQMPAVITHSLAKDRNPSRPVHCHAPSEPAVTKVPNCGWKLIELTAYTSLPSLHRGVSCRRVGYAYLARAERTATALMKRSGLQVLALVHLPSRRPSHPSPMPPAHPAGPASRYTHRWHLKVKFLDCRLSSTWCTATRPSMLPIR